VESYKGTFTRDIIADAFLQYSEEKYGNCIPLPPFLVRDFDQKDPLKLAKIYFDYGLIEVRWSFYWSQS